MVMFYVYELFYEINSNKVKHFFYKIIIFFA